MQKLLTLTVSILLLSATGCVNESNPEYGFTKLVTNSSTAGYMPFKNDTF